MGWIGGEWYSRIASAFQTPVTSQPSPLVFDYSSLLSNFGVRDYGSGFAALYMCDEAATTILNLEP